MTINPNLVQKGYTYVADKDGQSYNVRQSAGHAAAGSLAAGVASQPNWGKISSHNKPRTVSGINGAQKAEVVCGTLAAAQAIIAAGTFSLNSVTYTLTGYEGEHVTINKV